jgi:hypothetical protein
MGEKVVTMSIQPPMISAAEPPTRASEVAYAGRSKFSWQDILYLAILVLLVGGMAIRFTPNITGEVPGIWWDPLLNVWTLTWDTTTLLHAPTHLWQAPLLYPNKLTLSYSENLLGEAMLFAPFFLITHNPVLAYNMVFYLTFLLCGINMYILARTFTGKPFAAFVAALIYAFAPYRIGQIDHIHVIAGEWIPLAFLYLDRSLKYHRWRYWSLFALFYLLQFFSSIYYGIFLSYTLLAYLLICYARPVWKQWHALGRAYLKQFSPYVLKPAVVFGGVLIILGILMAPYLLSLSSGLSRGLDQTEFYSAFVRDFGFTAPFNMLYGISSYNGVPFRDDSEHHLFLGLTTMSLTLLGILLAARRKDAIMKSYAWTALVVLIFSFGPFLQYSTDSGAPIFIGSPLPQYTHPYPPSLPMPWLLAYFILPGFKGLRVPARLVGVLLMFLALLSAYAVAWLQEILHGKRKEAPMEKNGLPTRWKQKLLPWRTRLILCVLVLIPGLLFLESVPRSNPVTQVPTGNQIPAVYQWLATHGGNTPIVELPMADYNLPGHFQWKSEAWYDYYTIYHPHPIMNGWSGYQPPLTTYIASVLLNFPSSESVALLKRYHIEYVVVHPQLYVPQASAPSVNEMEANPELRLVAMFGDETVWQVR